MNGKTPINTAFSGVSKTFYVPTDQKVRGSNPLGSAKNPVAPFGATGFFCAEPKGYANPFCDHREQMGACEAAAAKRTLTLRVRQRKKPVGGVGWVFFYSSVFIIHLPRQGPLPLLEILSSQPVDKPARVAYNISVEIR